MKLPEPYRGCSCGDPDTSQPPGWHSRSGLERSAQSPGPYRRPTSTRDRASGDALAALVRRGQCTLLPAAFGPVAGCLWFCFRGSSLRGWLAV